MQNSDPSDNQKTSDTASDKDHLSNIPILRNQRHKTNQLKQCFKILIFLFNLYNLTNNYNVVATADQRPKHHQRRHHSLAFNLFDRFRNNNLDNRKYRPSYYQNSNSQYRKRQPSGRNNINNKSIYNKLRLSVDSRRGQAAEYAIKQEKPVFIEKCHIIPGKDQVEISFDKVLRL